MNRAGLGRSPAWSSDEHLAGGGLRPGMRGIRARLAPSANPLTANDWARAKVRRAEGRCSNVAHAGPSTRLPLQRPLAPEATLSVASARRIGRSGRGSERSVEDAGEGDVEGRVGIDVLCMFDVLRDGGVVAALEDLVDQWRIARSPLPLV
jgi:hypothetical protein